MSVPVALVVDNFLQRSRNESRVAPSLERPWSRMIFTYLYVEIITR